MAGLGTVVNALAIVAGGLCGLAAKSLLKERYQETITKAMGFAIAVMALGGALSRMLAVTVSGTGDRLSGSLETRGAMMMTVSLAVGALLGEWLELERRLERFGSWLRDKTGSQGDGRFTDAFVSASLTVCVGAMAVIGAIQDGISGDHSTLFAKAILDFIIIMMMTASLGKGCIFSALPVALFQGTVTVLAGQAAPLMTGGALDDLALVGNVLILCVGVNLIRPGTIRVANVLPALAIAVLFAVL